MGRGVWVLPGSPHARGWRNDVRGEELVLLSNSTVLITVYWAPAVCQTLDPRLRESIFFEDDSWVPSPDRVPSGGGGNQAGPLSHDAGTGEEPSLWPELAGLGRLLVADQKPWFLPALNSSVSPARWSLLQDCTTSGICQRFPRCSFSVPLCREDFSSPGSCLGEALNSWGSEERWRSWAKTHSLCSGEWWSCRQPAAAALKPWHRRAPPRVRSGSWWPQVRRFPAHSVTAPRQAILSMQLVTLNTVLSWYSRPTLITPQFAASQSWLSLCSGQVCPGRLYQSTICATAQELRSREVCLTEHHLKSLHSLGAFVFVEGKGREGSGTGQGEKNGRAILNNSLSQPHS